ncbi:CPBP family intramembrane metalloprotease domain-containing protein [Nostoc sp. 'Peltigera membranacea cyanobiont' 213]|uniref:CPBP family glutamic-type intramembrane protease n=1 Tax=Nostoc sp. 'Peltigera membranacea cyanobiont' 213 TaxID=2014530 RepID=UPI000B9562C5|nr:CPBP family glutamic-type intramembrane protease [Nostoc sp. 'Peltigera membranacea cyanobiont' 213]OYD94184.1 CPBP family intramembrane metalloprotease domain-containing protein [Nostoc sp. 'Peltigera membranacea cyanobiont' 213]
MIWRRLNQKIRLVFPIFLLIVFIVVIASQRLPAREAQLVQQESNYAIHTRQNFNQPGFYPVAQIPSAKLYKPVGDWVGRLILPTKQQLQDGLDWVWMEVQYAPPTAQNLLGKIVRLEWKKNEDLLAKVKAVTRDINFTSEVIKSQNQGNIHPFRLNGVRQVGILRSLAGANPNDDAIVALDADTIINANAEKSILQIEREPVMATGRFYGLVKIINPVTSNLLSTKDKQDSDYFSVQHYNPNSNKFDGIQETIRIPQQVIDTRNFAPSSSQQIEKSPAGEDGWYIYGAKDANAVFTVNALAPRSLFQIQPRQIITGKELGLNYIQEVNWQNTEKNKGKFNTALLKPVETSISKWQQGDKAIVLHLFGGIGGRKAEAIAVPYTITGHFAFGIAEVVRDEFTKELRFETKYHQIYAHNPDGIIAGTHTWADYMGNLQRGWLATRPVSDILIKFDPVTQDYDFDGIKLSPLEQFQQQLQVTMARYRVGDGTGGAMVSPGTSCVQDSSQALYAAIMAIKNQVATTPQIQTWIGKNPNHPQALRFQQLVELGKSLEQQLAPLGIIRADWQSQAGILAGTGIGETTEPFQDRSVWAGLTTWRTIMPRQAHDDLAIIFFKHGATMQVLRTNQVGGWQSDIIPIAPTVFLGQFQIPFTNISPLSVILNRVLASLVLLTRQDWLVLVLLLIVYSIIAIPYGWKFGFLQINIWSANWIDKCLLMLRCLFTPAIIEELFFRVILLPHPSEITNWLRWSLWAIVSLVLFILYHPLNAKLFFKAAIPTFFNHVFLTLTSLLGIICTVAYTLTGSLWVIVLIHWVVVVIWLIVFGGIAKLDKNEKDRLRQET